MNIKLIGNFSPKSQFPNMQSDIVEALYKASGHELTREKLILRFYGRQDVSTHELDRAINKLVHHNRVIQWTGQGYRLSDKYMDSEAYKVRVNEDHSR